MSKLPETTFLPFIIAKDAESLKLYIEVGHVDYHATDRDVEDLMT